MTSTLPLQMAGQTEIPDAPQFVIPIAGEYLEDYYLLNYVDWSHDDIQDYQSGKKTYDGHQGTDFVIKNFAQMDAGVDVLAAADGVVTFVEDSLFDRNKTANGGGFGNYVAIRHDNDYYTYYAHLKQNSATVQVGDKVSAGQVIGQVGSSGHSSDPHLHFEVWYDSLYNWDPFSWNGRNASNLWLDTLPYIDYFGVIDQDFTSQVPTLDNLKERLPKQNTFSAADPAITFWMQGYGVFEGDEAKLKWLDPKGNLWFEFDYVFDAELWYFYWWSYIDVPPVEKAGTWTAQFFINGDLKIAEEFTVLGASSLEEPAITVETQVFQDPEGGIILVFSEPIPFKDEIFIVDMQGRTALQSPISAGAESTTLAVSADMKSGVYVLYSKLGYLKPLRFTFVR